MDNIIIKLFFTFFFFQKLKNEQTKLLLQFNKVFDLPVGRCQFHAAHASFILIMLFLAL